MFGRYDMIELSQSDAGHGVNFFRFQRWYCTGRGVTKTLVPLIDNWNIKEKYRYPGAGC